MANEAFAAGPQTPANQHIKPTRARFFILFFLLVATIVNYIDRANLSIAMPFLSKELGFDKVQIGYLFGAWGLTYAFALVPGGYIADLFGSRISYAVALVSWSIATVFQGFANGYNALFGARLAVGLLESPAFPANARAVAMWFPMKERGLATSVYVTGQYIGTPLFTGLLIWIASSFGWRYVFYVTGGIGILLGLAWYFIYQDPKHSKRANAAELRYIEEGGGLVQNAERTKFNWRAFFELLTYRQILAICLGKFCSNTVLVFFGTWFIPYLVEERKMTMIKTGIYQALPYLGATAGILLAGFFADLLIRRGFSMSTARKAPLIIGSLDRKSTRLNSSHPRLSRMPSSA